MATRLILAVVPHERDVSAAALEDAIPGESWRASLRSCHCMTVIGIRPAKRLTKYESEVTQLAFSYWLDRLGVADGSPEDDFARAQREVWANRGHRRH
jgi:hypothetical protein